MTNLIYIHIGKTLPEYIYDSIYQSILVSNDTKIYVLLDDTLITLFNETVNMFNNNIYTKNQVNNLIVCVPLSIFKLPIEYTNLIENLPEQTKTFRDSFWVYTIARFFYLQRFMNFFHINSAFHIENDIMIYENLTTLEKKLNSDKLYMVRDNVSPPRVIASIMYLNKTELQKVLNYIIEQLRLNPNLNDMELLGSYVSDKVEYFPFDYYGNFRVNDDLKNMVFDGAALGQFLGGIDPRNIQSYNTLDENQRQLLCLNNPTKGFINETCTFKANEVKIYNRDLSINGYIVPLKLYFATSNSMIVKQIINTHIHSKQLYQFSSVFNLNYSDIITGDRVISLCDFVITTNEIYSYHKNIEHFIKLDHIIKVQNFKNVNINALNSIFNEEISLRTENKHNIKLFIYTHILSDFVENILFKLSTKLHYTIYIHNSDHGLENDINFQKLLDCKHIKKVYAQNINCNFNSEKFSLLPIGLANSMFNHGDTLSLYTTMKNSYYLNKTKNLYVNINPNTFSYRSQVIQQVNNERFTISSGKPFKEYLKELSTHRFSLCVRGNGIDCHRNFESLYLGVIPVIINNKFTNMDNHVQYMRSLGLPFYQITSESLDKYSDEFFNEALYKKIIQKCCSSIYNLPQLKLSYYNDNNSDNNSDLNIN